LPEGSTAAGGNPNSVAVDPSGKFAYVVNSTQATLPVGSVSAYIIDAASGALTPVAGSPFPAGTLSRSITVDPSGRFAYVANSMSNNVSAYTIDATSGALTAVTGSPFAAETGPASVTVDPSGRFAYVANGDLGGSNNVSAYTIDAATGALTLVAGSPFAAGTGPLSVTVDPSGKFAYVANSGFFGGASNVSAYTIDATSGALTPIAGSPFAAGTGPLSVTVDPSDRFVYVANFSSNNVSAYTIVATSGALTAVAGSPFAATPSPRSVTVDPSGQFAYVANLGSDNVSAYTIDAATGALTAVAGSPFPAGSGSFSVTTTGTIQ